MMQKLFPELNIIKSSISVGVSSAFGLLHITDTHLAFADSRDCEQKTKLAQRRADRFFGAYECLCDALEYASIHGLRVLHTGDLIDFVSVKNLEYAASQGKKDGFIFAAGNHEYSQYVGEAVEDESYKALTYREVQACFADNLRLQSHIINGVNIVTLDNAYYYIRREELESFKSELKKGMPIILCVHNPFYEKTLFDYMMNDKKESCAYLVGCPQEVIRDYPPERYAQQRSDRVTEEFCELLNSNSVVKAVIAGHIHESFESVLPGGAVQYITGLTCRGEVRQINVI